jgi:hypothetical protein
MIKEGTQGEVPLPTIDPRLAQTEPLDVGFQEPPSRPIPPDMQTMDFPLRQEVLNQPEIKQAVDNFRMEAQRLTEAGDQAGLDQLTRDFTAGMQRLGIARPEDAFGRGLYEGGENARYLETGIRRGGERNPDLTTMPEAKGLPFGGKQPTPAETEAFRKAMRKRQGGQISLDLLGVGKVADLLKKVGSEETWNKFRGTFDSWKMFNAEEKARDPNSRETLVWMNADDFHKLASKRPEGYMKTSGDSTATIEQKRADIRTGLQSDRGLSDIPYLWVTTDETNPLRAEVFAHEGRHRGDVFKELGVDKYPVRLVLTSGSGTWKDKRYASILAEDGTHIIKFPEKVFKSMVPASQRGGAKGTWNPFKVKQAAKDFIGEMNKKVSGMDTPIKDTVDVKQSVFEKLGYKGIDLIDSAIELNDKLIAEFKAEPDAGPVKKFVSGAVAKAAMNMNKAILWAHRTLDNGSKRGQYLIRENVLPVEKLAHPVLRDKDNLMILHDLFIREMKDKRRFTPEEMAAANTPEEVRNVYTAMREMYDKSLAAQNAARKSRGLKEITAEQAYLAARWEGPYKIALYAKNKEGERGKTVWQIAERSRGRANKALQYLKDKGLTEGLIIDDLRYAEGSSSGSPFKTAYYDLIDLLGKDDPRAQAIMEALKEEALYTTTDVVGQEKHFRRKTGTRGFAGDRPWMDPVKDARDMFIQQFQYAKNSFIWSEYQKGLGEIKKLLSDTEWADGHKNTKDYISYYTKAHAGFGTKKEWAAFENGLAKSLGVDVKRLEEVLGITKGGFYVHTLSWNLPFFMTQVLQPTFTAPTHKLLSNRGYEHNPAKTHMQAMGEGSAAYYAIVQKALGREAQANSFLEKMPPVLRDAVSYMEANGLVEINPTSDITDLHMPAKGRDVVNVASLPVVESEKLARSIAFMGFVSHLDQSGKFPDTKEGRLELFRSAEEATQFTMVDYRPQERAQVFNEMGLAGHMVNTFTAFKLNQLAQVATYYQQAKKGNPVPLIMLAGLMYALGGATGMLGVEDADALLELAKLGAKPFGGLPPNLENFTIKGFLLKQPDIVAAGPVSTLTGLNLYTRFNQSDIIPVDPLDPKASFQSLFPYASAMINSGGGLYNLLFSSNYSEKLAGGYQLTPPGMRGLYEEYVPGMKQEGIAQSVSQPGSKGVYKRSEEESLIRKTGFKSLNEAMTREKDFQASREEKKSQTKRTTIANRVRANIALGQIDGIEEAIKDYFKWGGDPNTLMDDAEITQRFIDARTTELQRLAIKAQTGKYPATQALLRRLQYEPVP